MPMSFAVAEDGLLICLKWACVVGCFFLLFSFPEIDFDLRPFMLQKALALAEQANSVPEVFS